MGSYEWAISCFLLPHRDGVSGDQKIKQARLAKLIEVAVGHSGAAAAAASRSTAINAV